MTWRRYLIDLAAIAVKEVHLLRGTMNSTEYPAFITHTDPSATPRDPACPSRDSGWLVTPQPPQGASRVATISLRSHAAATTPVEPLGARFAHSPSDSSLPRFSGGSASTLQFSRPAQRFTARCSLRARGVTYVTLFIKGFSRFVTSTTAPIATGWSESCRVGLSPTG